MTWQVECWNYALEDVLHMGPYLHTLQLLHAGRPLTGDVPIEPIPHLSFRSAEPVAGRVYPLFFRGEDGEVGVGTLCVAPEGKPFVMIKAGSHVIAADMEHWQTVLRMLGAVVGPLVHRANAVVDMGRAGLGLIVASEVSPWNAERWEYYENWKEEFAAQVMEVEGRHFLNSKGQYKVTVENPDEIHMPTVRYVHEHLLKLGTHVLVDLGFLSHKFGRRMPHAHVGTEDGAKYLRGWRLRYPDETTVGDPSLIYVCYRVKRLSTQKTFLVEMVGVPLGNVRLPLDGDAVIDYLLPQAPQGRTI